MADETVTDGEVEAFMAKLSSVDFTDRERSLLRGIVAAAVPGEVEGFDQKVVFTPAQLEALRNSPAVNSMWPPSGPPKH